jgi:hypothetical protein
VSGESGGCSNVVTFFFSKKSLTKTTGVLEHCREEETNFWFYFFGAFSSDRTSKATKDINVHFLFTVDILVHYASEFREYSEAATYILIAVN